MHGITEEQLRAIVREAVARHLAGGSAAPAPPPWQTHASHGRLPVLIGRETGGECIIEPAVRCNHCGYCQSMGH
jgi:hypothetical protein